MRLLLVYPPFAPGSMMPFSVANLKGMVQSKTSFDVKALDLNAKFHKLKSLDNFDKLSRTLEIHKKNNSKIKKGDKPEFFDELLKLIEKEKADYVAFSIVYSSQCFYAERLIEKIKCPVFLGGPGVSSKIKGKVIGSGEELVNYLNERDASTTLNNPDNNQGDKFSKEAFCEPDFSDFDCRDYLSPDILPVKSTKGCYYGRCSFCSHHMKDSYKEIPLPDLNKKQGKHFFFIDDMISLKRLKEIASKIPEGSSWWAQLRPTKELLPHIDYLAEGGLKSVAWGVESGSQRMLDKMRKGTNVNDISMVLRKAKKAGIINTIFIMFGFPGETREDFFETMEFLENNKGNIDIVSTSTFGLQKDTYVYENPEEFGIEIVKEKRTFLDDKIDFYPKPGTFELKKKYTKRIESFNKFQKGYAYLKEQTLFL